MSQYVFCGLAKMQKYLYKAGLELKVYKWQAGQRQKINYFSSAFVSFCISIYFLSFFIFLLKNKRNISNGQRSSTKQPAYPFSFSLFFFLQNFGRLSRNIFQAKLSSLSSVSPGHLTPKKPKKSSANNNHQTRSLNFLCLYIAI